MGAVIGGMRGVGEEPGGGEEGIELGARDPRRSRRERFRRRAAATNPGHLFGELRRVLRNQVAELRQRLHYLLRNSNRESNYRDLLHSKEGMIQQCGFAFDVVVVHDRNRR